MANYPSIIPVTPSYLEHWYTVSNVNKSLFNVNGLNCLIFSQVSRGEQVLQLRVCCPLGRNGLLL